ncbi:MAG: hypothetical protein J0I98_03855 [Mesorhizobium sp.]|nr:hypothetical protein [Mesorhizobium sp.]MBN9241907.1 hypothetical protein [Mesorhizobium sp.]
MRDLYSNIGVAAAIVPAVKSSAADGITVDTKGFSSVAFVVNTGAIVSDGDFGVAVFESDESSANFGAADAAVVDSNAPATLVASSTYKVGYSGHKRYVRLQLTKAGGTSIACGAVAVLSDAQKRPVS